MKNPSAFGDHGPLWSPWSFVPRKNSLLVVVVFLSKKYGKLSRLGMTLVEDDRFIPQKNCWGWG
jgi:hypothetical protein